jgi:hypothetical protein
MSIKKINIDGIEIEVKISQSLDFTYSDIVIKNKKENFYHGCPVNIFYHPNPNSNKLCNPTTSEMVSWNTSN